MNKTLFTCIIILILFSCKNNNRSKVELNDRDSIENTQVEFFVDVNNQNLSSNLNLSNRTSNDSCVQIIDISPFFKKTKQTTYSASSVQEFNLSPERNYVNVFIEPSAEDYDTTDRDLVNDFFNCFNTETLDYDIQKAKKIIEKITDINTQFQCGETILSFLVLRPNLELINLVLNKGASIDLLWDKHDLLESVIMRNRYNNDPLLFKTSIIEDFINSKKAKENVLYEAFEFARLCDVIFIEELIKSRFNHLGADSSYTIEINYDELENLSLLVATSNNRVLSRGVYAYATCINARTSHQTRYLRNDITLYSSFNDINDKVFIDDNMFLFPLYELDVSCIFVLWKKEDNKLKLLSTLDKKFNPGKYGVVEIEELIEVSKNKYFIVFRTYSNANCFNLYDFGIFEFPSKVNIFKSVNCISCDDIDEYVEWYFNLKNKTLKYSKLRKNKEKPDSLVLKEIIKLGDLTK